MKKHLLLLSAILFLSPVLWAKQISLSQAESIARSLAQGGSELKRSSSLQLVYTAKARSTKSTQAQENYYYVFNIGDKQGFVIVAADDVNVPVIGYSREGSYDLNNMPTNFSEWMESVELGMSDAIAKGDQATPKVKAKWDSFSIKGEAATKATIIVAPLVQTKWSQSTPYNNYAPSASVTGCVATTMAQIMKYYNYPPSGTKATLAYTTTTNGYSLPSVDLTAVQYDWANMANEYAYGGNNMAQDHAVAQLMYHAGLTVEMNYAPDGSGAVTSKSVKSLMNYFDYDKDAQYLYRNYYVDYSKEEWIEILKREMDNRRPVIYSGQSLEGGHAFVCDGYDSDGLFHFNWGWGGYQDGYFDVDAPLTYVNDQSIGINLKPNAGGVGVPFFYTNSLNSVNSVYRNEEFTPYFAVFDLGFHNLTGIYKLALYDQADQLVTIITKSSYKDAGGWQRHTAIVDSSIEPGNYTLKIIYEKSAGVYDLVVCSKDMTYPTITVKEGILKHNIRLRANTPITSTMASGRAGDSFDVNLSFGNSGATAFEGYYGVGLADMRAI